MTKILSICIAVALELTIVSCGNSDSTKTDSIKVQNKPFYGFYIPQKPTVFISSMGSLDSIWTVVIIDTDFDLIPETPFIVKVKVLKTLDKRCGSDSIALVCGIKSQIGLDCPNGKVNIINRDSETDQNPVITDIMEFRKKSGNLSDRLIRAKK